MRLITVSLLLLVAVSHASHISRNKREAKNSDKNEKGSQLEPNENLNPEIQPDELSSLPSERKARQYAAPTGSIAKISDLFSGQSSSFPSVIASHLYAPISPYQSRVINSPTTFAVSSPVSSQLAYLEHEAFLGGQPQENLQQYRIPERYDGSRQQQSAVRPPNQSQQEPILPILTQYLPRQETSNRNPEQLDFSKDVLRRIFPSGHGLLPPDFYHQINQLSISDIYEDDNLQNDQNNQELSPGILSGGQNVNGNNEFGNAVSQTTESIIKQPAIQFQNFMNQPQAVSYTSFNQTFNDGSNSRSTVTIHSPTHQPYLPPKESQSSTSLPSSTVVSTPLPLFLNNETTPFVEIQTSSSTLSPDTSASPDIGERISLLISSTPYSVEISSANSDLPSSQTSSPDIPVTTPIPVITTQQPELSSIATTESTQTLVPVVKSDDTERVTLLSETPIVVESQTTQPEKAPESVTEQVVSSYPPAIVLQQQISLPHTPPSVASAALPQFLQIQPTAPLYPEVLQSQLVGGLYPIPVVLPTLQPIQPEQHLQRQPSQSMVRPQTPGPQVNQNQAEVQKSMQQQQPVQGEQNPYPPHPGYQPVYQTPNTLQPEIEPQPLLYVNHPQANINPHYSLIQTHSPVNPSYPGSEQGFLSINPAHIAQQIQTEQQLRFEQQARLHQQAQLQKTADLVHRAHLEQQAEIERQALLELQKHFGIQKDYDLEHQIKLGKHADNSQELYSSYHNHDEPVQKTQRKYKGKKKEKQVQERPQNYDDSLSDPLHSQYINLNKLQPQYDLKVDPFGNAESQYPHTVPEDIGQLEFLKQAHIDSQPRRHPKTKTSRKHKQNNKGKAVEQSHKNREQDHFGLYEPRLDYQNPLVSSPVYSYDSSFSAPLYTPQYYDAGYSRDFYGNTRK